jgi:hypothetical protein
MRHLAKRYRHFAAAGLFLLASCATTKISGTWKEENFRGPIRKVVVVGVFETYDTRKVFEYDFADRLKARGIEAIPSYHVFPGDKLPTREASVAEFRKRGVEHVLVTRVLDRETWMNVYRGKSYFVPTYYGYYGDYYGYVYTTGRAVQEGFAYTETNLFELDKEKLVWSSRAETDFKARRYELIQAFVKATIRRMSEEGVIR